jgi:hypothetical protein
VATAVVIITLVAVVVMVIVLARQGSVGKLSEENGRRRPQDDVMERPAGPGAESMGTDEPGRPVTPPPADEQSWPEPPVTPPPDDERPEP